MVPYQPPEKLITEILERDNNTGKSNKHGNSGEEEDDENSHMDMDDWEYTMMWELFLKNSSNQKCQGLLVFWNQTGQENDKY